jgi:hypothetical protein
LPVGGAELQPEATPLLGSHTRITWRSATAQGPGQPGQCIEAIAQIPIERDNRREFVV